MLVYESGFIKIEFSTSSPGLKKLHRNNIYHFAKKSMLMHWNKIALTVAVWLFQINIRLMGIMAYGYEWCFRDPEVASNIWIQKFSINTLLIWVFILYVIWDINKIFEVPVFSTLRKHLLYEPFGSRAIDKPGHT